MFTHQIDLQRLFRKREQPSKKEQSGFTLIELMVTILIGLLLTLAVLLVQTRLSRTNLQLSDSAQRNDQSRTALNQLQYDLGNALYMVNGTSQCAAIVQYRGTAASTPPVALSAVSVVAQSSPASSANQITTTPLDPTSPDPATYVTTGINTSADVSDIVAITVVPTALRAPPSATTATAPYKTVSNAVLTISDFDAINNGVLPLNNNTGITAGDNLTLVLPMTNGTVSGLACLRFKADSVGTVTTSASQGGGTYPVVQMPSGAGFKAFNTALQKAGLLTSSGTLTNTQLSGAKLRDEGAATSQNVAQTVVYYAATVSNGVAAGTVPVLARALVNPDGSLAAQPTPVAAGVVSLQVRFGTDGKQLSDAVTGDVTHYLTWSQVASNNLQGRVRSVLYALVSRTLQSNPDKPQDKVKVTQVNVPSPGLASGDTAFTPFYPRTTQEQYDRYTVQTAEVALRNQIWGR